MSHNTLVEAAGWAVTIIAVGGVILNNRRRRGCFYLWLASDAISAVIHASAGMVALTVRDLLFLVLAVHGLILWTRAAVESDRAFAARIRRGFVTRAEAGEPLTLGQAVVRGPDGRLKGAP